MYGGWDLREFLTDKPSWQKNGSNCISRAKSKWIADHGHLSNLWRDASLPSLDQKKTLITQTPCKISKICTATFLILIWCLYVCKISTLLLQKWGRSLRCRTGGQYFFLPLAYTLYTCANYHSNFSNLTSLAFVVDN